MWQDIGVGIGRRRPGRGVYSPLSISVAGTHEFADGDQPYAARGISVTDSTPAWLPAGAVFFADFDSGLFFWDGAYRSHSDLTDNGDGTFDVDLVTPLDMGNLSGFVEVTNAATPVLNETVFGLSNAADSRFEVVTSSGDELRIYDTGTLGFANSGFYDGGGSNSAWKRFRCAWSYSAGSQRLVLNGYSDTAANTNAVSVPGMDRIGIGYRRWFNGPLFSGTVHKVCIIDAAKTDAQLRELNRYERANIGVHWLGDSFLNGGAIRNDFDDLVVARGQYFFTSTDQAGTSSLSEQAARFAARPVYRGQTLVIVDGGLTTDDSSVAALQSIVGNLTHDRWLYVQSNPKEAAGTGDRPNWDDENSAIQAFCGSAHYLETLSVFQANGDGSPEDNADIANDVIPRSLRSDVTHLNAAGQAIAGQLIYDRIVTEGWLAGTVKLTISDGNLTVGATTSATVAGNGTAAVVISGSEADVNTELATLLIDGAAAGAQSLSVNIHDPATGRTVTRTITITVTSFDYYVDSVSGNDDNAGSLAEPLQSLSALPAQAEGQSIGLKKGGLFRQRLTFTRNSMSLAGYGSSGPRPKVNAADLVTLWVKTAGLTNVYEAAFTVESGSNDASTFPRAFENDAALLRQTSTAGVDATAGSYYVTGTYPDYTVYVHAGDSGDPAANGSAYEVSTRLYAVDCPTSVSGCTLDGVDCEKPAHIDGAVVLRGRHQTIRNARALHGSRHNWFIGSGLVDNVDAEHAEYSGSIALGVIFLTEPGGESAEVRNARFACDTQVSSGLICHVGGGATTRYASLTMQDISGEAVGTFLNFSNTDVATIRDCNARNCGAYVAFADVPTSISGGSFEDTLNNTSAISWITTENANLTVRNGFTVRVKGSNIALFWVNGAANVTIDIDGLITDPVHRVNWTRLVTASDANLGVRNTYFNACHQMYDLTAMRSLDSDDNIVGDAGIDCRIDGTTHATLAAYQAAEAPLDANTVVGPLP